MKEKKDDIVQRESVMHHLFIHSLTEQLKGDGEFEAFLKEIGWHDKNKDDIETYLVVGNRKFPLKTTCEFWDKQIDEWVAKKAQELLDDKLRRLSDIVFEIEKKLKADAAKLLGLKFDEDGYPIREDE